VLCGSKDVCVYGGRRCFGGESGGKEEEILRAGTAWCSKHWVTVFDPGECAAVFREGFCKVFQGGVQGYHC
jgi:hypothetical protein